MRGEERACRQAAVNVTAARVIANQRLDDACNAFARELLFMVKDDRSSSRWLQFFPDSPSQLIRLPLNDQVAIVQGWLAASSDPVLENHRAPLTSWSTTASTALVNTRAVSTTRGQVWQAREKLGSSLTASRDALHRMLAERAAQRGLSRAWPDLFFLVDARERAMEEGTEKNGSGNEAGTETVLKG